LLDNPELPTFIARLETPTLNKLIEHVGLDDAGPLIAYTTDRQLRSILDESLWSSLAPGRPETHRPEEFIRWLYILQDQGEVFLAERLFGLGLDYLVLNFAQLVGVNDPQAILSENYEVLEQYAGAAPYAEEFSGYYVTAVYDEEWDVTRAALAALQAEHPGFLERLLYRMGRGEGSYLMHDISGERRDSKERAGYVTPESATAFLELTRQTSLASLVVGENHDPVSKRYFAQLGAFSSEDLESASSEDAAETSASPSRPPDIEKQKELEALLVQAEIVTNEPSTLRLSAPEQDDVLPVKCALDGLQHIDAKLFSDRLSELVYLSNVLIAGTILDGKRFDETEAAHAVLATCNIGMSYLGGDMADDQSVRDGLVRLFRIGWQILLQIPRHVTAQLVATLRSSEVTQKLFDRKWILSEVDATLDELVEQVDNARFSDAKTSLMFISLVVEQRTCDALQVMISDYPRYPLDHQIRYVESMHDLSNIDHFLGSLADHAKYG
jgi:hypothetical protein